ncbi:MAG: dockerin type I repeat-containing protein, partial [Clostridia bacterium]|nr:dockerin type I repeat-containing protein [Clostridia bacterium]
GGWFMPYIDSERTALVSMNKYYESTLSSIGTTSYMSEGDRLTFDYMVSSEYDCDTFSFNVYLGDEEVFSIERSGDQVWHEYEYVFEQSGDYHFGWSYFKDISVDEGDDCAMIDNVRITRAGDPPMPSLDEALNPDGSDPETWLSFSSGGSYPFIVDCDANGRLFAVSTNQGAANSSSSVSTGGVFADGAVLHFEYQISSEANYDGLIFCDNGSEVFSDSGTGNTNWQTFTYVLTGGWHDLEWTYSKDQSANAGEDCVRLDNVYTTWTPPVEGIPGDVDGNGTVTVSDAIMALRCAMGILTLTPEQFARADIDGSSTVTVSDAIMILRTAMGLL